jgi:hypothetical protein
MDTSATYEQVPTNFIVEALAEGFGLAEADPLAVDQDFAQALGLYGLA